MRRLAKGLSVGAGSRDGGSGVLLAAITVLFFLFAVVAQASAHGTITIEAAAGSTGEGTITVTHYGSGTDPLNCRIEGETATGDCTTFAEGGFEELEFHATPEGGSSFTEWSATGALSSSQCGFSPTSNPCEGGFSESNSGTLKAKLKAPAPAHGTITITGAPGGTGEGTVTVTHYGSGTDPLNCHIEDETATGDCTTFAAGGFEELEFHATPEGGSSFTEWSATGALSTSQCGGSPHSNPCEAGLGESESGTLTAKFAKAATKTLTITQVGTGTLECEDEGAPSFGACAASYDEHHVVKIREAPGSGFFFGGWSEFAGSGSVATPCNARVTECEVRMDADVTGKATFSVITPPTVTMVGPGEGSTAGAQTVTITGTNLQEATQVQFGTTTVSAFDSDTATQIVLQTPLHAAGQVDVTVTTASGTSTTSTADEYTFVAPPAVTGLSPSKGSTNGGNQVQITGLRLAGATRVEFGTTVVNAPFIEDTATTIKLNAPAHVAGTVDVRVTTNGGASAVFPVDRYAYETPIPAPSVIEPVTGSSVLAGPLASNTTGSTGGPGNTAPTPRSNTKPAPLTRAQKLALALRACVRKPKSKRGSCRAQAKKRYGPLKSKSKTKPNNKKKGGK